MKSSAKTILMTMRNDKLHDRNEVRSSIDTSWFHIGRVSGLRFELVPNDPDYVKQYLDDLPHQGLLLTGGNNLAVTGISNAEEQQREEVEKLLIERAVARQIPVLGVCRGMQALQAYFGGTLKRVKDHVGNHHDLQLNEEMQAYKLSTVNSYHEFGWLKGETAANFAELAWHEDGVVEMIKHFSLPIWGIMWHPERPEFTETNIKLIKGIFKSVE